MSGIRSGMSGKIRSVRTPNTNDEYRGEKKGGDIDTFWWMDQTGGVEADGGKCDEGSSGIRSSAGSTRFRESFKVAKYS